MPHSIMQQDIGGIARVRQRHYLIDEVDGPTTVGTTVVRLSCIDPDDLGRPLEVIWEAEPDAELRDAEDWGVIAGGGFDPPDRFAAFYHTLRWNRVTASRADLFQAPFRAGISMEHYQLEPLRMALAMPRVNLFIADGVGLGKTIEAGLVARELLIRRKVSDVVVCCPPSMVLQWREEMENRFGLPFQILDRNYVHQIRKERGFSVNPWATHNRFIISHNRIKDEEYAADLRAWLGRGLVRPRSLLILDEAHHAAPAAAGAYAVTSQFTRRIEEIAPKFEHKIFLSATPHNGHSNSFSALMATLDPQRFCRGVKVGRRERDEVLVFRLKDDLRELNVSFPRREVEAVRIPAPVKGTPELELANWLEEYCGLREARLAGAPAKVKNASAFLKSGLQQRLLSSIDAFYRTLSKHNQTIQEQLRRREAGTKPQPPADFDEDALAAIGGGLDPDDDADELPEPATDQAPAPAETPGRQDAEAERQTEAATLATLGDPDDPAFARERALLDRMLQVAERARHQPDEKLKALLRFLEEHLLEKSGKGPARWNRRRILVFTEYDDTLAYIRRHLDAFIAGTAEAEGRLEIYRGSTQLEKRQEIQEAFNADPADHPVRILLATDAAREGLNLQKHCADLFHFDIPWNPARLEQRNGRIDRKLQPAPVVHCRYFVYENRQEDAILQRLVEKTERIYRELGGFGTVLDRRLIDRVRRRGIDRSRVPDMLQLFDREDPEEAQRAAQARAEVSGDDEDDNDNDAGPAETRRERIDRRRRERLVKNIEQLRERFEASRRWLGFRDREFRAALDCALHLMDIDGGLTPEPTERPRARRYRVPTEHLECNPAWRETLNSLRAPRRRGESVAEWYARCPVRPIVFEDPGLSQLGAPTAQADGPEPVHMHLEHRVSRRLLGRFLAQGFVYHDLSRACLAQSEGSIPLVYLIARLSLYGDHAARLHEDLVAVCAEWTRPETRTGGLQPTKLPEEEALRRLDDALLAGQTHRIPEARRRELLDCAQLDVTELLDHLRKRADALEKAVRRDLLRTGDDEAEKTRKLLERQRDQIEKTLRDRDREDERLLARAAERKARAAPALFDTGAGEPTEDDERIRRERAAERRAMVRRLEQLPDEIAQEPDRIRARFAVQNARLEPVGLVYLWPEKG